MTKRSKMGRPPKPKDEKASVVVSFKTTRTNYENLRKLARERGMSMSAVIVALIVAAAAGREPAWIQRKKRRGYARRARLPAVHHLTRIEYACRSIEEKLSNAGFGYEEISLEEAGDEKAASERLARLYWEAANLVDPLQRKLMEILAREGPNMTLEDNEGVVEKLEDVAKVLGEDTEGEP